MEGVGMTHINCALEGEVDRPTVSLQLSRGLHCGAWPGIWMLFGLCLQLLASQRYACVGAGAGLLFKVLTGQVTRKGHGCLPATGESLAT